MQRINSDGRRNNSTLFLKDVEVSKDVACVLDY